MPLGLTPLHLVIILVIVLIVVGPGKLPSMGKALGESIREFRKSVTDVKEAVSLEPTEGQAAGPVLPAAVVAAPAVAAPFAVPPIEAPAVAAVSPAAMALPTSPLNAKPANDVKA